MTHQTTQTFNIFNKKNLKLSGFQPNFLWKLTKKSLHNILQPLNNPENYFGIIPSNIAIFTAKKSEKMTIPTFEPSFWNLCQALKFFVSTLKWPSWHKLSFKPKFRLVHFHFWPKKRKKPNFTSFFLTLRVGFDKERSCFRIYSNEQSCSLKSALQFRTNKKIFRVG